MVLNRTYSSFYTFSEHFIDRSTNTFKCILNIKNLNIEADLASIISSITCRLMPIQQEIGVGLDPNTFLLLSLRNPADVHWCCYWMGVVLSARLEELKFPQFLQFIFLLIDEDICGKHLILSCTGLHFPYLFPFADFWTVWEFDFSPCCPVFSSLSSQLSFETI